ncbi:Saccharopine dehydrogenase-domain-containing protein [Panaeolus papilionaceus]|nr:Saccharopine dehydrogenase-domain-containing protein [Panaeolus papilionaceus]
MTITKLARQVNPALKEVRIGVRREDPRRIWERRVPLTPDAVYDLVSTGNVAVSVQSCSRRIFKDEEYEKAGASVVKSVNHNDFDIVLGIKEPLVEEITPLKPSPARHVPHSPTHFMFSHTIKGQAYNMPLLSKFVAPSHAKDKSALYPDLIDFELVTSSEGGKRTVGFGWFAGVAGVLESLASMAQSHLEIGIASPFLYTPRPHTLPSLDRLRAALREIGETIAANGTPPALGPFVIGLTGNGNVTQGCLSMLQELPIEKVRAEDLEALVKNPETSLNKIYLVHAQPEDYFVRTDGGKYSRDHYYTSPNSYVSVFAERIAPYLTLFLNGTGWSPSFPRLMSNDQLGAALSQAQSLGGARFTNIGDISCDVEGGLQFLTKATTISSPFYKVRTNDLSPELPAVQMMSVDILPASIPLDASKHFSSALGPYLKGLIDCQLNPGTAEYPEALARARIATGGFLTAKHKWLQPAVDEVYNASAQSSAAGVKPREEQKEKPRVEEQRSVKPEVASRLPEKKHKILMLGSGMVAGPAVDLLAGSSDVQLVIGSNSLLEMQSLASPHLNVAYRMVDIGRRDTYEHLIKDADVVISLLPAPMHPDIAKLCIQHGSHLVTASYIAPEMEALASQARKADITILNEIGLDPGIDHISARAMITELHSKNLFTTSFTSFCGGLPAPADSNVPLRYKFSWRPNGVLTAATNSAVFKLNKETVNVPGEDLLKTVFSNLPISEQFELEGIANRNSLQYMSIYQLEKAQTFIRGTLRYPGFSSLMQSFRSLGLLNQSAKVLVQDWTTFVNQCVALHLNIQDGPLPHLSSIIPLEDVGPLHDALVFLGLARSPLQSIADTKPMPPLPEGECTPLDVFAYLLSHKLKYERNERDMVVLAHEVITRDPKKDEYKVHTSTLTEFGKLAGDPDLKPGERPASAMARTVGIPVALAARMVARNKETFRRGVLRPTSRDIYTPLMSSLEEHGLGMKETVKTLDVKSRKQRTVSGSVAESYANMRRFERGVAGDALNDASKYLDREWVDEWPEGEEGDFMKKGGMV